MGTITEHTFTAGQSQHITFIKDLKENVREFQSRRKHEVPCPGDKAGSSDPRNTLDFRVLRGSWFLGS